MSRWQHTSGWVLGKPVPLPLGLGREFWNQMGVAGSPCQSLSPEQLLHSLMAQFVHLRKEDDSTYLAAMWGLQNEIPAVKLRATQNRCSGSLTRFSLGPHSITDHQRNITEIIPSYFQKSFYQSPLKLNHCLVILG